MGVALQEKKGLAQLCDLSGRGALKEREEIPNSKGRVAPNCQKERRGRKSAFKDI